jgi:hypothetical protein
VGLQRQLYIAYRAVVLEAAYVLDRYELLEQSMRCILMRSRQEHLVMRAIPCEKKALPKMLRRVLRVNSTPTPCTSAARPGSPRV